MDVLAEIKRRNVIRAAGLYLVGAWLLVQIAGTVFPWFNLSASILRGLVIVLTVAFLPGLMVAWAFELMEQAYLMESQWLGWLRDERTFDPLRKQPSFVALMDNLGFKGSTP